MDKLSRQKFDNLKSGDSIVYIDEQGAHCDAEIVGWINHNGLPAALCGQHGDRIVPLARVVSRTRNGGDRKEWSTPGDAKNATST